MSGTWSRAEGQWPRVRELIKKAAGNKNSGWVNLHIKASSGVCKALDVKALGYRK